MSFSARYLLVVAGTEVLSDAVADLDIVGELPEVDGDGFFEAASDMIPDIELPDVDIGDIAEGVGSVVDGCGAILEAIGDIF